MHLDLNCDMGESFGAYQIGDDEGVMPHITSANVACGFHGGDPAVMRRTLRLARANGVAVGAHPGFQDLAGFGRRDLRVTPQEAEDLVLYQVGALEAMARAEGVRLAHVKPHGALYNMAAREEPLAEAIARAIRAFDPSLVLFALAGSRLQRAAEAVGVRVAPEGFADRSYEPDGSLTPRSKPDALIHDAQLVVQRAVRMAREGLVSASDGRDIPIRIRTLCVHGDTPGAATLARELHAGLERAGVIVRAPGATG
jgi:5-oxoprolinase (ATP-hydrolysing) subunit A